MPLRRKDILHPELSYKVIGAAFSVYNKLGWGHRENIYQGALEVAFKELKLGFEREKFVAVTYNSKIVGREFLDFVVDEKIVVELKVMPKLGYIHINQVMSYLKATNLNLALLIYFLKDGVRYRRIVNL